MHAVLSERRFSLWDIYFEPLWKTRCVYADKECHNAAESHPVMPWAEYEYEKKKSDKRRNARGHVSNSKLSQLE